MNIKKNSGFNLIELLVVLVIIGIITSIALPGYRNYVLKSARSEGKAALLDTAAKQEQYYLDNKTYTNDMTNLGYSANPWTTEQNKYSISIPSASNTAYSLLATRTGEQSEDVQCGDYTYDSTGTKGVTNATKAASACW